MVAMFIVFDFVIQNPLHPKTKTNLSYLDIIAAHFARLDLVAEGSLHDAKVAEFTSIARLYIEKCTRDCTSTFSEYTTTTGFNTSLEPPNDSEVETEQSTSRIQMLPKVTVCPAIPDMVCPPSSTCTLLKIPTLFANVKVAMLSGGFYSKLIQLCLGLRPGRRRLHRGSQLQLP